MINKEKIIDNKNKENLETNNKEEKVIDNKQKPEKDKDKDKDNKEDEFKPIMQKLLNKSKQKDKIIHDNKINNKTEEKNEISEKSDITDNSLKLPFMRLSKGKLNTFKYNTLLGLEPFYTNFNNYMDKKGEEIIKEISSDYKDEEFEENKIIFRYGDEADRLFIIKEGEVSIYFPFTEVINMNIDEYYIYILRLRRYNEIEMLNNVLLLNRGEFMIEFDEGFNMDEYLVKLYNTYLKLKFDATFLYKEEVVRKKKIKKIKSINNKKNNNYKTNYRNNNNNKNISYLNGNIYNDDNQEFDNNKFPTFNEREMKELVLRIGEEILETMKWVMPEKIHNIIEERRENSIIKKIKIIHNKLLQKYKGYNTDNVNEKEYFQRILPITQPNNKLIKKTIIVMKYLYIDTLKKGDYFGDFCPDSLSLFSPHYLSIAKNARINLKMHNFHYFRNSTAISTSSTNLKQEININKVQKNDKTNNKIENKDNIKNNKIHLISFNKKIFLTYFSKFIENMTYQKKNFLLNNSLFLNTTNKNLIKTYSICFKEKIVKEGEYIIKEKDKLNESNINIYFIIKGEFEANCKKSINQLDEIIKLLGHGNNIHETFPKLLKDLINTPYYYELIKKPLNLKLNYLNKNDIIGLSEMFINDEYFISIQCKNNSGKVYYVDARIIKLLVDSDPIINNNKNIMLYHKYEMLSDILLKQRKIYFDSFFNAEKYNVQNIITKSNNTDESNDREMISDNYTNNIVPNEIKYQNLIIIPKINKIISSLEGKIIINRNDGDKKLKKVHSQENILKNLGDLDTMLANLNGRFTLKDKRLERSMEFRKKYQEKMEKLEKEKKLKEEERLKKREILKNIQIYRRRDYKNLSFYEFKKCNSAFNKMFRVLPLLPNKDKYIKSEGEYKLVIPYKKEDLQKSNSTSNINPLAFDDFNRSFNTTQYFNFKVKDKNLIDKSLEGKKDYIIQLKSDIKLIRKKNHFIKKNDILTQKLRNIYKGKFDKVLFFNEKKLKKILE